jgi:hypothetical protein
VRRNVKLVATVEPPIAGVMVYFKVWDVDDPFDQKNPNMPDVGIIDGDASGPDNRPAGEQPWTGTDTTDENGKTSVIFTVSMQPGNNYRAGASLLEDAMTQGTQSKADALGATFTSGYSVPLVWSPMLTVWRKLWIERDTMQAPGLTQMTITGTAGAVSANVPVAGQSTVDLGQNLPDEFSDLNLYEEGTIRFFGCPIGSDTFPIMESTSEWDPWAYDSVVILGVPGACAVGSAYILRDDDASGVLPHYPGGGQLLIDAFAGAYILPVYAGAQYEDVVAFDMHLSDQDVEYGWGSWADARDLSSSAEFWSCLVVGCWEATENWDADPDLCFSLAPPYSARPGAEGVESGCTDGDSGRAAIYMEALRDDFGCMRTTDEAHTVTHEIGHTCGSHDDDVPNSIMEIHAPSDENRFASESIVIFRSEVRW